MTQPFHAFFESGTVVDSEVEPACPGGCHIRTTATDPAILRALTPHHSHWQEISAAQISDVPASVPVKTFIQAGRHWTEARGGYRPRRTQTTRSFILPLANNTGGGVVGNKDIDPLTARLAWRNRPVMSGGYINKQPLVRIDQPDNNTQIALDNSRYFKNDIITYTVKAGDTLESISKNQTDSPDTSAITDHNRKSQYLTFIPVSQLQVRTGRLLKVSGSVENSGRVILQWQGMSVNATTIEGTGGPVNQTVSWEAYIPVKAGVYTLTANASGAESNTVKVTIIDPDDCIDSDSRELVKKRLKIYWGTSNWDDIKKKARNILELKAESIPIMEERQRNWNLFKERHFAKYSEDEEFKEEKNQDTYLLNHGPKEGSKAYQNLKMYAFTDYGSIMIAKVIDWSSKAIKNGLMDNKGTRTTKGKLSGFIPFQIRSEDNLAAGGMKDFITLPSGFPLRDKYKYGGQSIDALAILHHEFEHTRFGENTVDERAKSIEEEVYAVKKYENPVRALNGLEPRYTYTETEASTEQKAEKTINIINKSDVRPGGWSYCKNDPRKMYEIS